jgi:hypothetical protein
MHHVWYKAHISFLSNRVRYPGRSVWVENMHTCSNFNYKGSFAAHMNFPSICDWGLKDSMCTTVKPSGSCALSDPRHNKHFDRRPNLILREDGVQAPPRSNMRSLLTFFIEEAPWASKGDSGNSNSDGLSAHSLPQLTGRRPVICPLRSCPCSSNLF